ncbi:undecaprenyl-diphosphatase UppP [Candidatus Parcubacteria bacterium]|nr:MAG: undecaprenyl-diphosphatase UppP [Candidatus Parcubacteria bacterium]
MIFIYLKSIIFGVIQGATEFLPVSSSGHLIILHKYLGLPVQNEVMFDVLLHLATLIAVIVFFWDDIKKIVIAWFKSFFGYRSDYTKLSWFILLATMPAALVGFFFENLIENVFRSVLVVAFMLVLVGVFFIVVEKIAKKEKTLNQLNAKNFLFIGIAQALALIPGTSRSGITIIAGLFTKLKREEAIRISFLMSIPIIAGASLLNLGALLSSGVDKNELIVMTISFASAFFSAILAIKYFLKFATKHGLVVFAYYRFLLALLIVLTYLLA